MLTRSQARRSGRRGPLLALVALVAVMVAGAAVMVWRIADDGERPLFEHEFAGSSLDDQVWSTCFYWLEDRCTNEWSGELATYTTGNIEVADDKLTLTAREERAQGFDFDGRPLDFDFTSGMVTTHDSFSFTYGYVEVRAKVPSAQGLWPAIWLMPVDRSWPPEIDIMEHVGEPGMFYSTVHRPDGPPIAVECRVDPAMTEDWHVFAAEWEPERITFYRDDEPCGVVHEGVPAKEMYLLLNLAVGGNWAGSPNGGEDLPAHLEVDWVRVWSQRPEPPQSEP